MGSPRLQAPLTPQETVEQVLKIPFSPIAASPLPHNHFEGSGFQTPQPWDSKLISAQLGAQLARTCDIIAKQPGVLPSHQALVAELQPAAGNVTGTLLSDWLLLASSMYNLVHGGVHKKVHMKKV